MEQRARERTTFRLLIVAIGVLALVFVAPPARAVDGGGAVTGRPLPRFASMGASKVNVRRGPGLDYRKDWVFRREGWPVKIVDEHGNWRRIVDRDRVGGWVYHAMLSGQRTVLILDDGTTLREAPRDSAPAVAQAEQGVVADIDSCGPDWCRVAAHGYEGWVRKTAVWGVRPDEIIKD